ncbi:MAG: antibiotic biosynthesis monooxygenase [Propionibacterium sp.]|nr:antibiotic biosynthesis monooxygenase [Propionibacterium sp.]
MLVLTRFQVPDADSRGFEDAARAVVALLASRPGAQSVELVRNLDEPDLWAIVGRWRDVGSYRRALAGMESRMLVVPLLSRAIDEASAYLEAAEVGVNRPRGDAESTARVRGSSGDR